MSQVLKLNGVEVNGHEPITWGRAGGVDPVQVTLELAVERAEAIFTAQTYVSLELNNYPIMRLYPLKLGAGSSPFLRTLTLADRRWEWPFKLVVGDYNLRRRTGDAHLRGPRVEVHAQVPSVDYADHSLEGRKTATPQFVLEDVLKQLVGGDYIIQAQLPDINIEDLLINDPGPAAMMKVLQQLPGLNVEITEEGRVRVYNDIYSEIEPRRYYGLPGGQYPVLADRSKQRPSLVEVFFVEESELRLDYSEGQSAYIEDLNLTNVVRVVEPSLTIPASTYAGVSIPARTVGYGTWVSMDSYLAALEPLSRPTAAEAFPLSQANIRRHWLQGFSRLRPLFSLADGSPDPLWSARLDTIYSSWRQTFQLALSWRDRAFAMHTKRVGVYDHVTATRAPTAAYCDYCARPTWKGIATSDVIAKRAELGWNVTTFTDRSKSIDGGRNPDSGTIDSTVMPSPFEVTMEDDEAFVFRLNPRKDPHYEVETIGPGTIAEWVMNGPGLFNRTKEFHRLLWEYAELEDEWAMSMVVTAIKGAPNGLGRYRKEQVGPQEAANVLKVPLGKCEGPVLQLFVPMQVVTARYAWLDANSRTIKDSFIKGSTMPSTCLVNKDHVRHVAIAVAARAYETYLDQMDGVNVPTAFDERLRPEGPLKEVQHTLRPRGGLFSSLTFGPPGPMRDLWPLLPDATRKALQHIVVRK